MANSKVKIAVFITFVILALVLVVVLVVHRSLYRDRICQQGRQLYYVDPITNEGTCYKENERGPCGDYMALMWDRRNGSKGVGTCQCDGRSSERALLFHESSCYFIFTQAYCAEDEWLTLNRTTREPMCEKKFCKTHEVSDYDELKVELVPLGATGRCVELGKYDNLTCSNESQVVQFYKNKVYPKCLHLGQSYGTISVPGSDCPPGYFLTGAGHCQPDFDFD